MRGLRTKALGGAAVLVASAALASPVMTTTAHAGSINAGDHTIGTADAEAHLVVEGNQTVEGAVSCPVGYFPVSGGFLADAVDDGDLSSIFVLSTQPLGSGLGTGWKVQVRNDNDGRAQGKVKVSCLAAATAESNGHVHSIEPLPSKDVTGQTAVAGTALTLTASCPSGIPVAPGYTSSGAVFVPTANALATGFNVKFEAQETSTVGATVRCISEVLTSAGTPSHAPEVALSTVAESFKAGAGVSEGVVTCPSGTTSVVPSYSYNEPGLTFLGADPRGTHRMFRFQNDFDDATDVSLAVACLGLKAEDPAPTQKVTVGETVTEKGAGTTVEVTITCVLKCVVKAKLSPRWTTSVFATGQATIPAGGTKVVALKAKANRTSWLKTADNGRVTVVSGRTKVVQEVVFTHS